jgi:hypothetical protein
VRTGSLEWGDIVPRRGGTVYAREPTNANYRRRHRHCGGGFHSAHPGVQAAASVPAALHVVERYRLIDYEAGQAAAKSSEEENRRLLADSIAGNGVSIDANYRDKSLQVQFTVEDENVFTMPWSAVSTYWHADGDWVERI